MARIIGIALLAAVSLSAQEPAKINCEARPDPNKAGFYDSMVHLEYSNGQRVVATDSVWRDLHGAVGRCESVVKAQQKKWKKLSKGKSQ